MKNSQDMEQQQKQHDAEGIGQQKKTSGQSDTGSQYDHVSDIKSSKIRTNNNLEHMLDEDSEEQIKITAEKHTAGKNDENNISIETIAQPVGNNISAYEIITTLPENPLIVTVTQGKNYKKEYTGTGQVKTSLAPVAKPGTKGHLHAVDQVTGESMELEWQWYSLSRSLWALLKRLLFGR